MISRKKIVLGLSFTFIVVLVIFTYTLFTFKVSFREQVTQANLKQADIINDKAHYYQQNIENVIFNTTKVNTEVFDNKPIASFIKILSNTESSGIKIEADFLNGEYLIAKDQNNGIPFNSLVITPDGLWVKATTTTGRGVAEYAYMLNRLLSNVNDSKNVEFFLILQDKDKQLSFIGLNNPDWKNKVIVEEGFSSIIKENGKTYSITATNEFKSVSSNTICYSFVVTDISTIKKSHSSFLALLITLGVIILSLVITLIVLFVKKHNASAKTEVFVESHKGESLGDYLGNHEINQIFNATKNGVRIINSNFDIVAVNKSFCKISGLENEQVVGEKCYTVFHGIYCHTANCPLERLKNGDAGVESNEFRFKKDGKRVRCIYTATPLLNSDNKIIGIVEDFKDISEKHAVEETLKQTEKQFEVFMDNLPIGVFIEDGITHEVVYQNTYLQNITGGRSIKTFLPAESAEKLSKSYLESEEENQLLDISGNWKYFNTHKFKFLGVNNQLKIGGVMIDITKKKEAEHYRDVLSKAIENSPVSVAILSSDTEIEFINPSFAALTGFTIEEIYSKEILNLNIEYNSGNNLAKAVECIKNGQIWQGEIHLKNKELDHFWVSASFTPIKNENGTVQHTVTIMENITKRKEYEKEILYAKSKAEESDKLKSAFLSNLSHEIRTPLNAIIGFSSLLSDNDLSFGERRNISEIIYRNSNDLLRLIENLIEISEIETGQLLIKKKEFSVNSMMSDLYRQLIEEDKKASNVKLSLRKEVRGDDLVILSDQTRLQQVLFQLLTNSCKFTENGFIEFGYSLKDENTLMFYVVDSGIGIEPEKQSLIFNPFRQVDDTSTRRYGGMGLGLAISKHIVEKLGGKIWINSTPKSGTSVYFTIPFIPVNSKFEIDNQSIHKQSFKWSNKTILVADDIDANYIYLKAALKKTDANVIWAKNGAEAVDFVKQGSNINIILMDIVMPELDGFEATKLIKHINNQIPIIGQTAYPSQKNFTHAKEIGFDSMLEKPIKVNRMLMELDKYLSN